MLDLTSEPSEPLAHAPVALAICQVNYNDAGELSRRDARIVQKEVGRGAWPALQAVQIVTGVISQAGLGAQPARQGWRLVGKDQTSAMSINPESVSLEVQKYPGWSSFQQDLRSLLRSIGEVVDPDKVARVGVRYLNQIKIPDGASGWQGLIPDELLGASLHPRLRDGVIATENKMVLAIDDQVRCLFRYGQFTDVDGQDGYLLDYDVYREQEIEFDADSLVHTAKALHSVAWSLFRTTTTEELIKSFR